MAVDLRVYMVATVVALAVWVVNLVVEFLRIFSCDSIDFYCLIFRRAVCSLCNSKRWKPSMEMSGKVLKR